MAGPQPLAEGPLTREQIDTFASEMMTWARERGREAARLTRDPDAPPPQLPPEAWDAKTRAGLSLEAGFRSALILSLDDQDRLADCDRSDLVAEALMTRLDV